MDEKIQGLIVRYLSNEATAEEAEELLEWVSKDRDHQRMYIEWMEAWENNQLYQPDFNLSVGLKKINTRIDEFEQTQTGKASSRWVAIAASISVVLVAAVALLLWKGGEELKLTEYTAPARTKATLVLADGSRVILNQNSTLRYPERFEEHTRNVELDGEAFFEVQKDSRRPFIIQTGKLSTQVLGTSFNIQSLPDSIIVSVATGRVKVADEENEHVLQPFEKAIYSTTTRTIIKKETDLRTELAWKNPPLIFQDTKLKDVAEKLTKHFNTSIRFEKESLKECLFTGKFQNHSLETILTAIHYSTGVMVKQTNDSIQFYGKGCNDN